MATDEPLSAALERVDRAQRAMWRGDPAPYSPCWADADDVTLIGAFDPIERGHRAVTDTFRWVGSWFSGDATAEITHFVMAESEGLAYTVGMERRLTRFDGGLAQWRELRATHIYRRHAGQRQLVHRHADYPPPDPRRGGPADR